MLFLQSVKAPVMYVVQPSTQQVWGDTSWWLSAAQSRVTAETCVLLDRQGVA